MGKIAVEGMRFNAFHGFYPEEQVVGNLFGVDVYVDTAFSMAAREDDLGGTINYETIFQTVERVMQEPVHLLEHLAELIIKALMNQSESISQVTVRISKYRPPIGGEVDRVYIEETRNFLSECPQCGNEFIDYRDESCWCKGGKMVRKPRKSTDGPTWKCLCPECLELAAE